MKKEEEEFCVFSKNLIDLHKSLRNFFGLFFKCDKKFDTPILTHYASGKCNNEI